jgi:tRNA U34 5-methylaminomethyl-2-thiouridine-forming methyltransferase MnmC
MKEFKGNLGNYRIIKTEDNSETIWSEYFDENCHNTSGAIAETIYNYIEGCEVLDQIKKFQPLSIFDVGFGPGLGLKILSDSIHHIPATMVNYYSVEIDEALVLWSIKNTFSEISYEACEVDSLKFYQFIVGNITAIVFIGDARITVPKALKNELISPLHVIFQDPFSPKKNPTLWTVEWFSLLKELSHPKVIMSTYSSSISIRKSMIKAGFTIINRKGFGQKRTMTKALLDGQTAFELMEQLNKSPILELHDK